MLGALCHAWIQSVCVCGGGGTGGFGPPLKNYKNIRFLINTGPDPLKNHKATKSAFNVWPSLACERNTI